MKRNEAFKDFLRNCMPYYRSWRSSVYPRRFARVRPTARSSAAKLIVGPKAAAIDCRVVDYSPGGACLEVGGQTRLPNRFELLFGATRKRCRVVWSAGRRLGVAF